MGRLQSLPTELLHRILSLLADPTGDTLGKEHHCGATDALYHACLVSHKWRDLAQPLLFRNFDADDAADPLDLLIRFIKCISLRPELGKHVRTASIDSLDIQVDIDDIELSDVEKIPEPNPDNLKFIRAAISELRLGDLEGKWVAALDDYDFSPIVILLAHKTPNLRALRIPREPVIQDSLASLCKRDPSFLPSLDQIWIICDDSLEFGYDIGSYQELFTRRKILSPTFEFGDLMGESFPASWKPRTLVAEELAFNHCHIDATGIQKLLRACKKVKSFTYQNFSLSRDEGRPDDRRDTLEFNGADVHAELLPHKDTLEHFHLEYFRPPQDAATMEAYRDYCASRVKIPSFHNFPVLETLFVQHALLPQCPRFPSSLQRLDITDCNSSIRDIVADIASDCKRGKYPHLTEFKVLTTDITKPIKLPGQIVPHGQTPEQCFLSLQGLFKGTAVDFQILPYEMPDDLGGYSDEDYDDDDYDDDDDPYEFQMPTDRGELLSQMLSMASQIPELAGIMGEVNNHAPWEDSEDSD